MEETDFMEEMVAIRPGWKDHKWVFVVLKQKLKSSLTWIFDLQDENTKGKSNRRVGELLILQSLLEHAKAEYNKYS